GPPGSPCIQGEPSAAMPAVGGLPLMKESAMSRILRSIVAGIALSLTLGATAASARPPDRPAGREPAPAGIAGTIELLWNALLARVEGRNGLGGLSALWGKAGSQMDPDGTVVVSIPSLPRTSLTNH